MSSALQLCSRAERLRASQPAPPRPAAHQPTATSPHNSRRGPTTTATATTATITFHCFPLQELAQRTVQRKPPGPLMSLIGTPHADTVSPVPCAYFHPGQGEALWPLGHLAAAAAVRAALPASEIFL
jgi:hypothetical protein